MWEPNTEKDIRLAITEGSLSESSWLDVKAETGDTDGARRETAKDMASFAIDGGALLIGVQEDRAARSFSLAPISLTDVVEKIEQIAANRIDPPLHIRVREIATDVDANAGYIFVEVPPSPHAPHMVGGVYYARGERTTRRLTDAEVVRLHALRGKEDDKIRALLAATIARDPVPEAKRSLGHLYLVAEPTSGSVGMARSVARSANNTPMFELLRHAERHLAGDLADFAPRPTSANYWKRRARGAAFTTLEDGRELGDGQSERNLVDIELEEDGGFRITIGRLTDVGQDREIQYILDGLAVAYCLRLVYWAAELSKVSDYRGSWTFGLAATGLAGLTSTAHLRRYGSGYYEEVRADPYDREAYEAVTSAHLSELEGDPGGVAERLVGGLLRGLGSDEHFSAHFAKPAHLTLG